ADSAVAAEANYDIVALNELSPSELSGLLAGAENVYIEAAGDNPHHAVLLGLAIPVEERVLVLTSEELLAEAGEPVRQWLGNPEARKFGYDLHKADLTLHWNGIDLCGTDFDVLLAAYLLDPTESNQTLVYLMQRYELPAIQSDESVYGKGAKFRIPEREILARHLAAKADAVRRLVPLQQKALEEGAMSKLYY
ncbi:DNA polymerase I, partial [Paenibacillus sepulcri]|nr:DNA polymerase I [Paenibacillus sepulcri]